MKEEIPVRFGERIARGGVKPAQTKVGGGAGDAFVKTAGHAAWS